jgi:trans-2-enoyl-CoA reductase
MIFNNITVRGFWLVTWMNAVDKATRAALYQDLAGQIAKGTLFAPIDKHFTLEEIAEAAAYSWAGGRKGKVMLAPNGI